MKTWKIDNNSKQSVKFACKYKSGSKGIILQPDEFCVIEEMKTASIEAQERKKFIIINRNFNNNEYNYELVKAYKKNQYELKNKENLEIEQKNQELLAKEQKKN